MEKCKPLVEDLYIEPVVGEIVGSFLDSVEKDPSITITCKSKKKPRTKEKTGSRYSRMDKVKFVVDSL